MWNTFTIKIKKHLFLLSSVAFIELSASDKNVTKKWMSNYSMFIYSWNVWNLFDKYLGLLYEKSRKSLPPFQCVIGHGSHLTVKISALGDCWKTNTTPISETRGTPALSPATKPLMGSRRLAVCRPRRRMRPGTWGLEIYPGSSKKILLAG